MQFKFQQSVGGTKYMVQISEMLIVQTINLLHTGNFVIQGKEKKKKVKRNLEVRNEKKLNHHQNLQVQ